MKKYSLFSFKNWQVNVWMVTFCYMSKFILWIIIVCCFSFFRPVPWLFSDKIQFWKIGSKIWQWNHAKFPKALFYTPKFVNTHFLPTWPIHCTQIFEFTHPVISFTNPNLWVLSKTMMKFDLLYLFQYIGWVHICFIVARIEQNMDDFSQFYG